VLWLFSCNEEEATNNTPPYVDSNVVLRFDSLVLDGDSTQYLEKSFTFSKKLREIQYQFWGEENCTDLSHAFTFLSFRSTLDSQVIPYPEFDSIPVYVMNSIIFKEGDSCQTLTVKMGITDPPFENKYIKIKNFKAYSILN
jgi:hypothetical protein